MSNTDMATILALAIQTKILDNKSSLGLQDVLYGNQVNIPRTPTAVVNPGIKRRTLRGVSAPGGRTWNDITVFVIVHNSKVGNEDEERLLVDRLAESIETLLHKDTTMGGILVHGFVHEWNPGETTLQGGEFRTVRMTYIGTTETYLST